jgi:exportin-5
MVQLLERHCTAALSEAGRKQIDVAKLHAAAVTATLNAVIAYAEWAPLTDLAKSGIINLYVSYVVYLFSSVKYSCSIITLVFCSFPPCFLWTPNSCGFLLSAPEFRLHASEFFKLVSSRFALQSSND